MPKPVLSRADQIGALFAEKADVLRSLVARTVFSTDDVIDEACGFAWTQLLSHPDVDVCETTDVFWWLYRCAQREAWRRHRRAGQMTPIGHPTAGDGGLLSSQPDPSVDVALQIEHRETLRAVAALKPAVRETVVLHACGYTYSELRDLLGVSNTTILKRIRRARAIETDTTT